MSRFLEWGGCQFGFRSHLVKSHLHSPIISQPLVYHITTYTGTCIRYVVQISILEKPPMTEDIVMGESNTRLGLLGLNNDVFALILETVGNHKIQRNFTILYLV